MSCPPCRRSTPKRAQWAAGCEEDLFFSPASLVLSRVQRVRGKTRRVANASNSNISPSAKGTHQTNSVLADLVEHPWSFFWDDLLDAEIPTCGDAVQGFGVWVIFLTTVTQHILVNHSLCLIKKYMGRKHHTFLPTEQQCSKKQGEVCWVRSVGSCVAAG